MLQRILLVLVFSSFGLHAQKIETPYKTKRIKATKDTIAIDSTSVNSSFFKILNNKNEEIENRFYDMNFPKGTLVLKENFPFYNDSLTVRFLKFPKFLTKEYSIYDSGRVVKSDDGIYGLYKVTNDPFKKFTPFDGLNTSGSITRGISIGNNQNAVVNSNLDLQITGKISDKVSLRASIQDSNIPLQSSGYSQKLDEFDQVFIELFSERWNIRAGDLFLENRTSRFLNFSKKVQGLATNFNFGKKGNATNVFASAALVRGQYARSTFVGQEGNQGPYKLRGSNGELFILVISGSERVYVNGILLKRGENNDYLIDYNAGEIIFTSLFPINSEMRINVEYQFSDRNYSRFVSYFGASHERDHWTIGTSIYSENDIKNQSLQQNLSEQQVQVLVEAGDDTGLMTAPSAFVDEFSPNKILYKKVLINSVEVFEYSTNPTDVLHNVRFTLVGNNQGNYVLSNNSAIGRIYQYVAPIDGVKQGNYEPIIRLVPPTKIQLATLYGKVNPSEKTNIDFEGVISNNDLNLFSNKDDKDNSGIAGRINAKQRLFTNKWEVDLIASLQFVEQDFRTIERLYTIEFDRDWNLSPTPGNQRLLTSGLEFKLPQKGLATYQFENLEFSRNFNGNRHSLAASFNLDRWNIQNKGSYLNSTGTLSTSQFLRNQSIVKYHLKKNWVGTSLRLEDNQEKNKSTQVLSNLTQRFTEYGAWVGRGDSTKVYLEVGYLHRLNDSLQQGRLSRVNISQSYFLKSRLIQSAKSDLSVFINYRNLRYENKNIQDEPSLNSRILYNDRFFNQLIQSTTAYETSSGTIPQQEFTYLEVEAGQGVYAWNDYNANGLQELQEFEIAPFPDQAKYIRIFLPNQIFVKTHQNKFSESVTLNPIQWQNEKGLKKVLSHFYNQTSFLIDRKIRRDGYNFDLNPFSLTEDNLLGLNTSFRNSLFYNRGKQKHSVTYTYVNNKAKNLLSFGSQESGNSSHQIQYDYLLLKYWLLAFSGKTTNTESNFENFESRNFEISSYQLAPKISYLFSKNASWDVFYEYSDKQNNIGMKENLVQTRLGTSFSYASEKKLTLNGEFSLFDNKFSGDPNSAVAFQMLEGLQPGRNMTWRLLLQKNLTQYLDVNINYQGRKSETSQTIHNGNIQLRAYF